MPKKISREFVENTLQKLYQTINNMPININKRTLDDVYRIANRTQNKRTKKVDINKIPDIEFLNVPGIGIKIAKQIITLRKFKQIKKIEELRKIPYLGDTKIRALNDYFFVK